MRHCGKAKGHLVISIKNFRKIKELGRVRMIKEAASNWVRVGLWGQEKVEKSRKEETKKEGKEVKGAYQKANFISARERGTPKTKL